MIIRRYVQSDCKEIAELFYNTIHTVNARDYTEEQLNVWTSNIDLIQWNQSLMEHYCLVAIEDNQIVGFSDIDDHGLINRFYVHKDYQRKGIASSLMKELKKIHKGRLVTHASITAKPFFEKNGFYVVKEQQVERRGIFLTKYVMEVMSD